MGRRQIFASVSLFAALFAPAAYSDPTSSAQNSHWYVIESNSGARIGYSSQEVVATLTGTQIVSVQSMTLQERGSPPTVAMERAIANLDANQRATSIEVTEQRGGFESRVAATIEGPVAHVTRRTPSSNWAGDVALPAGVRFDDGAELVKSWDAIAHPSLEFLSFNIDAPSVDRVVLDALPRVHAWDPLIALRRRYQGETLLAIARVTIRDGEIVEVARPMFGATVLTRVSDQATALAQQPPYEVLPNTMTRSPFRISSVATLAHIRYRFAFNDSLTFPLPATGEQRVAASADTVTLDVCKTCGPGLPTDAVYLADALRPTAWMQSDNPRLRRIAEPVGRMPLTGERKMRMLIERAQPYFSRIDFVGHYSALDTLQRRAGDCTEAATLLAALGRAAGIPTRVASGLVYSREAYHGVSNAFLPHSWTLAYVDGRWKSFDLALENFDSTHIALTVGDGDERSIAAAGQLASLLTIDAMAEVRTRARS